MRSFAFPMILAAFINVSDLAASNEPDSSKPAKESSAKSPDASKSKLLGDPYPLSTCAFAGGKLGSMGDPIVKMYDGREVRYCCKACPPKFEKDLAKSIAKLDEALIKDQASLYPTDTSIVSGQKLPEKPFDWIYNNRMVRLTDEAEKVEFQKDPAKYLAILDKATLEKQTKDYPLKTCLVSKDDLGTMDETKDVVIAGRLIRLCCSACEKDVRKEPAKFIAMIDAARNPAGDKKEADKHKDGSHDDHKH